MYAALSTAFVLHALKSVLGALLGRGSGASRPGTKAPLMKAKCIQTADSYMIGEYLVILTQPGKRT